MTRLLPVVQQDGVGLLRHQDGVLLPNDATDHWMVDAWIAVYRNRSPHTSRSYLAEARRFRAFLATIHGESPRLLADATEADVLLYEGLLAGKSMEGCPDPFVISAAVLTRHGLTKQPFSEIRKSSTIATALAILCAMYEFFRKPIAGQREAYVLANPVMRVKKSSMPSREQTKRLIPEKAVNFLLSFDPAPGPELRSEAKRKTFRSRVTRARWICHLLMSQWLRAAEAVSLKVPEDIFLAPEREGGWVMRVLGKGRRERRIPVLPMALEAMKAYRLSLMLPALPSMGDKTSAAIGRLDEPKLPFSPLTLLKEVQWFAELAAKQAESINALSEDEIHTLRAISPHWFRHTGASRTINATGNLMYPSRMLGHASINTTTQMYWHEDLTKMRECLETGEASKPASDAQKENVP